MWTGKKKENLYTLRAYYLRASNYNGFANGFSKDSHNKSSTFDLYFYTWKNWSLRTWRMICLKDSELVMVKLEV